MEMWQQEARKLGGESLVEIIQDIRDGMQTVISRLDAMEDRHETSEASIALLRLAFPVGDTEGHRRYHELMIESLAERRRLRTAITEKTLTGLVWLGLGTVGIALWLELKRQLGLPEDK